MILLVVLAAFGSYIDIVLRWYRQFLDWFYSVGWSSLNAGFATLFAFINIFLILFIINTFRKYHALNSMPEPEATPEVIIAAARPILPKTEVVENWTHIRELANSSNTSDWNMAIIRADALLDDILRHLGYEGESMADRLKIVDSSQIRSLDEIWSAHRLRNMIAHNPIEQHTKESITYALNAYERGFKELGML